MSIHHTLHEALTALDHLEDDFQVEEWHLKRLGRGSVFQGQAPDHELIALKFYDKPAAAQREFGVLASLRDFGINLAPEPYLLNAEAQHPFLIMSWVAGEAFSHAPRLEDETAWHRLMAVLGASGELHLMDYSRTIPMMGWGYQNAGDVVEDCERRLGQLGENHVDYERLAALVERVGERVEPTWNNMIQVGLCRMNHALADFLWDGHHLLAVDWDEADWGDMAAEIGFWCAHPDFEDVPNSHWVWARWEFARLTRDKELPPRATVYTHLAQVWWSLQLTVQGDLPRRDRYLARAEKIFRP